MFILKDFIKKKMCGSFEFCPFYLFAKAIFVPSNLNALTVKRRLVRCDVSLM